MEREKRWLWLWPLQKAIKSILYLGHLDRAIPLLNNHHKYTMEAPSQDLTPTLARSRSSLLVPQPPPSPGTPGTPGTPSTPVARPVRSGKARDLLRQHYGMNIGPPAPLPGRPHDPMNIGLCPCSQFSSFQYIYS